VTSSASAPITRHQTRSAPGPAPEGQGQRQRPPASATPDELGLRAQQSAAHRAHGNPARRTRSAPASRPALLRRGLQRAATCLVLRCRLLDAVRLSLGICPAVWFRCAATPGPRALGAANRQSTADRPAPRRSCRTHATVADGHRTRRAAAAVDGRTRSARRSAGLRIRNHGPFRIRTAEIAAATPPSATGTRGCDRGPWGAAGGGGLAPALTRGDRSREAGVVSRY